MQKGRFVSVGVVLLDENKKTQLLCSNCHTDYQDLMGFHEHLVKCDGYQNLFENNVTFSFDSNKAKHLLGKSGDKLIEYTIFDSEDVKREEILLKSRNENKSRISVSDIKKQVSDPKWFSDKVSEENVILKDTKNNSSSTKTNVRNQNSNNNNNNNDKTSDNNRTTLTEYKIEEVKENGSKSKASNGTKNPSPPVENDIIINLLDDEEEQVDNEQEKQTHTDISMKKVKNNDDTSIKEVQTKTKILNGATTTLTIRNGSEIQNITIPVPKVGKSETITRSSSAAKLSLPLTVSQTQKLTTPTTRGKTNTTDINTSSKVTTKRVSSSLGSKETGAKSVKLVKNIKTLPVKITDKNIQNVKPTLRIQSESPQRVARILRKQPLKPAASSKIVQKTPASSTEKNLQNIAIPLPPSTMKIKREISSGVSPPAKIKKVSMPLTTTMPSNSLQTLQTLNVAPSQAAQNQTKPFTQLPTTIQAKPQLTSHVVLQPQPHPQPKSKPIPTKQSPKQKVKQLLNSIHALRSESGKTQETEQIITKLQTRGLVVTRTKTSPDFQTSDKTMEIVKKLSSKNNLDVKVIRRKTSSLSTGAIMKPKNSLNNTQIIINNSAKKSLNNNVTIQRVNI